MLLITSLIVGRRLKRLLLMGGVIGVKKLDRDRLRNIHSTAIRVANAVEKTADKENWSLDGEG